ncbi:MAG TPA: 3-hydroxybutyryl-CoA dehydrogenase [Geothrix sp.]|nr:3-hydroxybutyryl-CoA dehydrogenase [Geothrix sp.]
MDIQRIGIVGCGLMGSGIAQCAAEAGCEVWVKEAGEAYLAKGLARINGTWDRAVAKGKITEDQKAAFSGRLHGTLTFTDLASCDLVVEAVPERMDLKLETFAELDRIVAPGALLCTNTSSLTVAHLSPVLSPGRLPLLAGLHFFNPVPAMPLVEIVRTLATGEDTLAALKAFVQRLGKTAVLAPDAPGFVVNRLLVPYLLDALRCAEQKLATVEDIDTAMRLGCGHPMGPLHLSDFIGLDTMQSVAEVLFEAFGEPRFKAPSVLRQLVAAGRLGRKSGAGFYRWEGEKRMEALPL